MHISTYWALFNPLESWKHEEILPKKFSELLDETIIHEDKIYAMRMSRTYFITHGKGWSTWQINSRLSTQN